MISNEGDPPAPWFFFYHEECGTRFLPRGKTAIFFYRGECGTQFLPRGTWTWFLPRGTWTWFLPRGTWTRFLPRGTWTRFLPRGTWTRFLPRGTWTRFLPRGTWTRFLPRGAWVNMLFRGPTNHSGSPANNKVLEVNSSIGLRLGFFFVCFFKNLMFLMKIVIVIIYFESFSFAAVYRFAV